MSKTKLALAAASVVMAFAANSAKAAIVYAPVTPINVSVGVGKTGFNETINFNLAGDSVINAAEVLLKNANTTSALQSLTATLSYKTSAGAWTTLWTDAATFAKSQAVGNWFANSNDINAKAGTYKLSLVGKVFANTSYSGSYYYQVSVAPVPEPETYALAGLGLTALLLRRKHKKAASNYSLVG